MVAPGLDSECFDPCGHFLLDSHYIVSSVGDGSYNYAQSVEYKIFKASDDIELFRAFNIVEIVDNDSWSLVLSH
ncbi:hypothetical protein B842_02730 [Corynebacterium humireducens NBRC 106098 = DSM 45392]|uniref:Uncharacterized protein n=1 Tax=Corynebacterium humireducens NBRC 106098 = DSM 45392 TaxID=1223515 RepID=A0A0B5D9P0_9CORY|nr:hypothetical protein B842_02730 [Corynebacterium humireducens NBRC 106098 = DSM 45392]